MHFISKRLINVAVFMFVCFLCFVLLLLLLHNAYNLETHKPTQWVVLDI